MVAAAVVAAGVISAGASVYSSNQASKAQQGAANSANSLQQSQYDQTRQDQAPYRQAGYGALARMNDLLGLSGNTSADGYGSLTKSFNGDSVKTDPGYQFGLNEGMKAAQDSAAAKGGLYSGATLKALTKYGNDYATTKFDDAFNRDQQTKTALYNKLAGVTGTGQTATTQVDAAGQNYATNAGNNLIGAGNARGAADIAAGNAVSGAVNQGGAWWMRNQGGSGYQTPSQFQDGTNFYGGSGTTLYGDGYGPG